MPASKQKTAEAAALKAIKSATGEDVEMSEDVSLDFNIVAGHPLPEGFENPPCGTDLHRCVANDGNYDPDWEQLVIESAYEGQANPQKFPLGGVTYTIPLDEWVDAPRCVIVSLISAVETHHIQAPPTPGDIALGKKTVHKQVTRKRFVYHTMPSA